MILGGGTDMHETHAFKSGARSARGRRSEREPFPQCLHCRRPIGLRSQVCQKDIRVNRKAAPMSLLPKREQYRYEVLQIIDGFY